MEDVLPVLYLLYQKCSLKVESVLKFMRLTLEYSECIVISVCIYHCKTNNFTNSLTGINLLQPKIHNI